MTAKRLGLALIALIALLVVLGLAALHFAAQSLKQSVIDVLGPTSEISDLRIGLADVVITGILIKAPPGWPARTSLQAERVVIVPDIRGLFGGHLEVRSVRITNGYISAARPKEGGGLTVLPGVLTTAKNGKAHVNGRTAEIKAVELDKCVLEFFDATVAGHQKMRIDAVAGTLTDLKVPSLKGRITVDLKGIIRGPNHQGTITVGGWVNVAEKSSQLTTRVRNVDLALFEPYVIRKTHAGIDQGTFNLDLKATVRNNVLSAPGTLTLTGLKLKEDPGAIAALSSVPAHDALRTQGRPRQSGVFA